MTTFIKRITAALALCLCLASLSGCREEDGSGGIFKYDIPANPQSLDPQTASDSTSDMLIASIYKGLLVSNPDGSLGEGVAEDYTVSDDGLVYTFKLRQDNWWVDSGDFESQCTAHDFVFAFQRLFDPSTRAARASEYYCIKNSQPINRGMLPDLSQLGVKAIGDFELEITLDYPNPQFPVLLTQTPAMPCSEEYFLKSQGKYGLSAEKTPSNGSFYVKTWDYDPFTITDNNHIILRRNYKNNEVSQIYPSGLNFFIVDEERFVSDFTSGVTSCIAVTDEQAMGIDGEYTVVDYSNISVGLLFNFDYSVFKNADFRRSLASLVDRKDISAALSHYTISEGVVPEEVSMLDQSYREYAGSSMLIEYNKGKAEYFFGKAEELLDKDQLIGARIILPDDSAVDAVSYIMQEWQKHLGFYCKMEVLSREEYSKRLQNGDYEIAVAELGGGYNSPEAYLKCFTRDSSENYSGYFNSELEKTLKRAGRAIDLSESADLYVEAEKHILSEAVFIPLFYKNEYFFIGEEMSDIFYNPFTKTIDFTIAKVE
ncbi:MAG: peptide ABC transporter substrate-binding protein [Oscillospiraceae bacterium]|nr:peptide ABC transporter substrate-binding protein [Oscillospiraceae bacterium]